MNEFAIFYADDDEDDLIFFNDAVEKIASKQQESIQLHIHRNGERLLETIKSNTIEKGVVFLDINMPRKSGFQLLEEIRNTSEIKQLPVIIYSTSYDEESIQISHNLGANYYVVKPYNFDDLIQMICDIVHVNWHKHSIDLNNFIYYKKKNL